MRCHETVTDTAFISQLLMIILSCRGTVLDRLCTLYAVILCAYVCNAGVSCVTPINHELHNHQIEFWLIALAEDDTIQV
ncbi:hypothetical protein BDV06DRAFT_153501 [Aspergillus oleicola]